MDGTTLLRELPRQRHLKYETFTSEYAKTAAGIAPGEAAPSRAQYYRWLSGQLKGGAPYPDACRVLERMFPPWTAADLFGPYQPDRHPLGDPGAAASAGTLLDPVPHRFPAGALAGYWVTCFQFLQHGETPRCHADIACVSAASERHIRAVNHPPEPRTEGRALPFRNEIEAQLAGRHVVGTWKNTSDTRYFGTVQLAVLPGETVLDGHFTGVGSDIAVSLGRWKWVRLDPGSVPPAGLAGVSLREPSDIYSLVMDRSQYDAPLALDDVREGKDT